MEGTRLGKADVLQDAVDEVAGNVVDGLRVVVEGGDDGEDGGAGFGDSGHIANVNQVKGCFADAEDERAALLERDVGGALDEVGGDAVRDAGERAHGAGKNDHRGDRAGATGDGCADIFMRELLNFFRGVAEQFFGEIVFCYQAVFFREDTQSRGRGDEIDVGDAWIGVQSLEHVAGKDDAAGAGDGESESAAGSSCFGSGIGGERHQL